MNLKVSSWKVYIILCDDDSLYTGITTDVEQRFEQHLQKKGAKYFYGRNPLEVLYIESDHTRSSASKREHEIKALTRQQKLELINACAKS